MYCPVRTRALLFVFLGLPYTLPSHPPPPLRVLPLTLFIFFFFCALTTCYALHTWNKKQKNSVYHVRHFGRAPRGTRISRSQCPGGLAALPHSPARRRGATGPDEITRCPQVEAIHTRQGGGWSGPGGWRGGNLNSASSLWAQRTSGRLCTAYVRRVARRRTASGLGARARHR